MRSRGAPGRIPLKRTADEAVSASLSVEHVIVYRRGDGEVPWKDGRDLLVARTGGRRSPADCPALPVAADHPCLIIYTSGTTGRPKGTVLTTPASRSRTARLRVLFDLGESDRLFWVTDLGWLMGRC